MHPVSGYKYLFSAYKYYTWASTTFCRARGTTKIFFLLNLHSPFLLLHFQRDISVSKWDNKYKRCEKSLRGRTIFDNSPRLPLDISILIFGFYTKLCFRFFFKCFLFLIFYFSTFFCYSLFLFLSSFPLVLFTVPVKLLQRLRIMHYNNTWM